MFSCMDRNLYLLFNLNVTKSVEELSVMINLYKICVSEVILIDYRHEIYRCYMDAMSCSIGINSIVLQITNITCIKTHFTSFLYQQPLQLLLKNKSDVYNFFQLVPNSYMYLITGTTYGHGVHVASGTLFW
jgi:hypothetical protein